MSRWPFDLESVRAPVDLLYYGLRDASPVHSPDFGRTLAKRIPTATLHIDETAGNALLWTHAEGILRRLST